MKKEELIELIKYLHSEDKTGNIVGVFHDRYGGVITTDSVRIDMDGGRILLAQEGTDYYDENKKNWETELKFIKK
jgi:hypothetical protein|tara:strand:- start:1797 stop:2021 length:225 start_codon:yes stop_codon:yes gene_type:complete